MRRQIESACMHNSHNIFDVFSLLSPTHTLYTHTPYTHREFPFFYFNHSEPSSKFLPLQRTSPEKKLMLGGFLLLPCSSVTPVSQVKNISFRFHCSFFFYVATKVNVLMARFLRAFLACRLLEKYLTKP